MAGDTREIESALAALSVNYHLVDSSAALTMMREARNGKKRLVDQIREAIPETDLLQIIANELGYPYLDMHAVSQSVMVDEDIVKRCDAKILQQSFVLPMRTSSGDLIMAMANPTDTDAHTFVRSKVPEGFSVALSPKAQIVSKLFQIADDFEPTATGSVVPEWVDYIFRRSVAEGASDVHFRSLIDGRLQVRFRVDGVLRHIPYPEILAGKENEICAALLAKCPTMDSANMRDTQDGTFTFEAAGRKVDVRVAMLPLISGPNITSRLLDPQNLNRRLEDMGFAVNKLEEMRTAAGASQGALLVVGPTGSGKSTTLYSLLGELDPSERNIITLEDPVEYRMMGIGQTQIRNQGDRPLTFAKALRNVLRQDPDVILVGEMRDTETAKTAMDAAITGHMVFSTLHAHNAPGAYMRLVEMGLPAFLVSEAVTLIISQRLMRRVHTCRVIGHPTEAERAQLVTWGFEDVDQVARPMGCHACGGSGYQGRLAATEVLAPDRALRETIAQGKSAADVIHAAWGSGWRPILHDGIRHLRNGETTVSEIVRVIPAEDEYLEDDHHDAASGFGPDTATPAQ